VSGREGEREEERGVVVHGERPLTKTSAFLTDQKQCGL